MAFRGADLGPLARSLAERGLRDPRGRGGAYMDLSLLELFQGREQRHAELQAAALDAAQAISASTRRRGRRSAESPGLRRAGQSDGQYADPVPGRERGHRPRHSVRGPGIAAARNRPRARRRLRRRQRGRCEQRGSEMADRAPADMAATGAQRARPDCATDARRRVAAARLGSRRLHAAQPAHRPGEPGAPHARGGAARPHRAGLPLADHRQAGRIACRRGAEEARRSAPRSPPTSSRSRRPNSSSRRSSTIAEPTGCFENIASR